MPRKAAAKKPSSLAKLSALSAAKKRRKNSTSSSSALDFVSSSELGSDLLHSVGPGIGSYAATRLTGRLARNTIGAKFPAYARHIGAGGSLLAFVAAIYAAKKVKALKRYETPILIGGGLALIQTIIQLYLPGLSWLFDGPVQAPVALPAPKAQSMGAVAQFRRRQPRERFVSPGEIESERMEAHYSGRDQAVNFTPVNASTLQTAATAEQLDDDEDDGPEPDDLVGEESDISDLYDGVFSK